MTRRDPLPSGRRGGRPRAARGSKTDSRCGSASARCRMRDPERDGVSNSDDPADTRYRSAGLPMRTITGLILLAAPAAAQSIHDVDATGADAAPTGSAPIGLQNAPAGQDAVLSGFDVEVTAPVVGGNGGDGHPLTVNDTNPTSVHLPGSLGTLRPGDSPLVFTFRGRLSPAGLKQLNATLGPTGFAYLPFSEQALMINDTEGFVALLDPALL